MDRVDVSETGGRAASPGATASRLAALRVSLPKFCTATALTALSGFNDAVGYSALGHLYLSFMSGNSTHFGMSLASGDWPGLLLAGSIIGTFVAGTSLGTVIADRFPQSMAPRILGIELVIMLWAVAASYFGAGPLALVPVAGAMGMQNVLHQVIGGADVGKGFVTGSLFALGQSLARLASGREQGAAAFQNGWSWLSFVAGVCIGALTYGTLGLPAALGAAAIALAVMLCWLGTAR
ncbi:MAG TPA: YoaK family protein [Geminicoccus sp.]|uniref:YoaK family protein n=1 Tax=Geminicoccus sp. TaxID=2024832 RepID=UPI002B8E8CC4|nr:YoaK family protein [Geminicoccus sp.]HWL69703.1 YoaK family protein [Geminicoccus sp.]